TTFAIRSMPPARSAALASPLSAQRRAALAACSRVTSFPTFPVHVSFPASNGICPLTKMREPARVAGTYEPTGLVTGGSVIPSSIRRCEGVVIFSSGERCDCHSGRLSGGAAHEGRDNSRSDAATKRRRGERHDARLLVSPGSWPSRDENAGIMPVGAATHCSTAPRESEYAFPCHPARMLSRAGWRCHAERYGAGWIIRRWGPVAERGLSR